MRLGREPLAQLKMAARQLADSLLVLVPHKILHGRVSILV